MCDLIFIYVPSYLEIFIDLFFYIWIMVVMKRFVKLVASNDKYYMNIYPIAIYYLFLFSIESLRKSKNLK